MPRRGARVELVTSAPPPRHPNVVVHPVESAQEMLEHDAERTGRFPEETEGEGNLPLEPEVLSDGTKRFELTAEVIEWEVEPGKFVEAWTYNGELPGPPVTATQGDLVEVTLRNADVIHRTFIDLDAESHSVESLYSAHWRDPGSECFSRRLRELASWYKTCCSRQDALPCVALPGGAIAH